MTIEKTGGFAAFILAFTYIFGITLFLVILDPSSQSGEYANLTYLIDNKDTYLFGTMVTGILFSFALIALVQATTFRLKKYSENIAQYSAIVGYIWVAIVLCSAMIDIVSVNTIKNLFIESPEQAQLVHKAVGIVSGGLGGDIEIVGAVWVFCLSYLGLKYGEFSKFTNYLGLAVGVSGVLTLFSFLSLFKGNPVFELTTLIFGLGQILWFILLGVSLVKSTNHQ